jgi:glutathionyl-hydroquinone reductase
VQAIVDFPKWRLHDNSKYAAEHMLICEDWKWQKMPVLTSDEADIIKMFNDGLDVKEMSDKVSLAEKTIYKKIKKLKDQGVITDDNVDRKTTDSDAEDIC